MSDTAVPSSSPPHGGDLVAEALAGQGVRSVFTLCGGHISPILVGAARRGLRVLDARHEAAAVFAADAEARLTGVPGVAAVTAGPGLTNAMTAVTNARLAASPIVVLVGATATVLKGRGSLQDIDQRALAAPHVKWFTSARRVRDLPGLVREAFTRARAGVPGPVCLECPVDLLYPETVVRTWYGVGASQAPTLAGRLQRAYLRWHLRRVFAPGSPAEWSGPGGARLAAGRLLPRDREVAAAAQLLACADRPLLLAGSQALVAPGEADDLAAAIGRLRVPTYLSGMARGLLGAQHPLLFRHERRQALREADLVILAGVPCDFRLDYGRHIGRATPIVAVNRSRRDLVLNRRPTVAVRADPDLVLRALAAQISNGPDRWHEWKRRLAERDRARDAEIERQAAMPAPPINPLALFRTLDGLLADDSLIVADGGDVVATASYILRPRRPLSWLDPGVFGTLGVGGGFALGAACARPTAERWVIYGDGALGFSLAEFDTFARHGIPLVALVGNDASWEQIAREQVEVLGDRTATVLGRTAYHIAAEGLGGRGILLDDPCRMAETLAEARALARQGHAVLVNAMIGRTAFRKGSVSM